MVAGVVGIKRSISKLQFSLTMSNIKVQTMKIIFGLCVCLSHFYQNKPVLVTGFCCRGVGHLCIRRLIVGKPSIYTLPLPPCTCLAPMQQGSAGAGVLVLVLGYWGTGTTSTSARVQG